MVLDAALATTYTLDPVALLAMPLHLAWLSADEDKSLLSDGIRLLEAIRRVGDNFTVYADRGRIQAPTQAHPLYSFLESIIVEVRAPGEGAFHPKLWVLRFVEPNSENVRLRLGVLSRNLTADRCWDLALQLEGTPGRTYIAANRGLGELVRDLPTFAVGSVPEARREAAARLGDELRRTAWDLPDRWQEVSFHVLGRHRRAWSPPSSAELIVISPFLSTSALEALCATTQRPVALVSRPDQLAALPERVRSRFARCLVLSDAAESEDGEGDQPWDSVGLHAKALVLRCGWDTRLFVGSVNASSPAILAGTNLEVWAELSGKRTHVGGPDELLGSDGIGDLLVEFDPATPIDTPDAELIAAEGALDAARASLVSAPLSIRCEKTGSDWRLMLAGIDRVTLGGVSAHAWPLSLRADLAVSCDSPRGGGEVDLGLVAAADITGMTGFSIRVGVFEARFALNLPLLDLPEERDRAIARRIIQNREGFLRYLLLLLGELGDVGGLTSAGGDAPGSWTHQGFGVGATLLEELVRVFSRDPSRLDAVKRLVDRLCKDGEDGVIPEEFLGLWGVFVAATELQR